MITNIFNTKRGCGVFRERNCDLKCFTWLVIDMKVALLEAELKVWLSFSLSAISSSEPSSQLLASISEAFLSSSISGIVFVTVRCSRQVTSTIESKTPSCFLPISKLKVYLEMTPSQYNIFFIFHKLQRTRSFFISVCAPKASNFLC